METFNKRFNFNPSLALQIGMERERFLANDRGSILPSAELVLSKLNDTDRFTYELSACQIEDRIGPCKLKDLPMHLLNNNKRLNGVLSSLNLRELNCEVAPDNMPLDVYADPCGRYAKITKNMPIEVISAACRVVATHVHVGMPDRKTAVFVHNNVIRKTSELIKIGDHSDGNRMRLYRIVAPDCWPEPYVDWGNFYEAAVIKGFDHDPRKNWKLIRISVHGTIEFRMFGRATKLEEEVEWAELCHNLCASCI